MKRKMLSVIISAFENASEEKNKAEAQIKEDVQDLKEAEQLLYRAQCRIDMVKGRIQKNTQRAETASVAIRKYQARYIDAVKASKVLKELEDVKAKLNLAELKFSRTNFKGRRTTYEK